MALLEIEKLFFKFTNIMTSIESLKAMSLGSADTSIEALNALLRIESSEALEFLGTLTSEALKILGTLASEIQLGGIESMKSIDAMTEVAATNLMVGSGSAVAVIAEVASWGAVAM